MIEIAYEKKNLKSRVVENKKSWIGHLELMIYQFKFKKFQHILNLQMKLI